MFSEKPAIVLVPGIQGRWEWMAPAVHALEPAFQVLTFSLSDAMTSGSPSSTWFDSWTAHIDALLDRAGVRHAVVAGVSFGGLIALHYAAMRPARTSALVLVSTPDPAWAHESFIDRRIRYPMLALPGFAARGAMRMAPEVAATHKSWLARARFSIPQVARVLAAPPSPRQMAAWVRAWRTTDLAADCRAVRAPTLVITGEARLDRIVPVDRSRRYLELIQEARYDILPNTGHLGVVLQAERFARMVREFADASDVPRPGRST